ncbi:MAG: gluconate 2-dehydrogenase subunit 3 family protein [Actinobacteria bacterium]|nr:gluconate 2-dehydrogenase subunit 3 family protein [Actinomycetota bacterium]
MGEGISRRSFVRAGGALGLLALVPAGRLDALLAESARAASGGRFLTAHELDTLRAVCGRLIPGPPEDPDPGAREARVPEAIDLLLGAFEVSPPMIHAGGPFSGRAGGKRDDFARFVPLDRHAELGWRIRIEGTRGIRKREFAGPVRGLQQIYREGLAHLDDRAAGSFALLPGGAQDLILSDQSDGQVQELVGAAFANALEAMYGAPEYGGNHGLAGWSYTHWPGDRQPRGYTDAQVSGLDASGPGAVDAKALAGLERFLPCLAGAPTPRGRFWAGHRGLRGR